MVLFFAAAVSTALGTLVVAGAIPGWPTFGAGLLGAAVAVALLLKVPIRQPVSS